MNVRTDLQFNYEMSYLKQRRDREGEPPAPPRFGRSFGEVRALPLSLSRPLQPLYAALAGEVAEGRRGFGEETIAAVAHYTLGLSRYEPTDLYALHRPSPSPRCLVATELYYLSSGEGASPRGVFRFNPVRHCLEPRSIPEESPLSSWLATQVTGAAGGWLLSSVMDRIGYLYGRFAARLSLLECGHVISQMRLVSGALGVATEVLPCYKDPLISEALGPGETPLSLIRNIEPPPGPVEGAGAAPRCPRPWLGTPLYRAMLQRSSAHGRNGVLPVPVSLRGEDIAGLAWYAMEEARAAEHAETIGLTLYMVVSRSEDLEPSIYRWDASQRALQRAHPLPEEAVWARALFTSPGFAARLCPLICVMAADLRGACRRWGEGGYFRALEQAGRAAQRIGLAAAAMRLFARPAVSLDEAATDRMLRLHLARETAIYTVLVGQDRDRGFPVRMAL